MDWDQDKGVFYFIDTADSVVRSYPVDENGVPKRSQDGVLLGVKDVSQSQLPCICLVHCITHSPAAGLHLQLSAFQPCF